MTFLPQSSLWDQAEVWCPTCPSFLGTVHFSTGKLSPEQSGTAGWPCLPLSPRLCFSLCLCHPTPLPPLQVPLESPPSVNHVHKHPVPASASRRLDFSGIPFSLSVGQSSPEPLAWARGSCCYSQSSQLHLAFGFSGKSMQVEVIMLLFFAGATCGCLHVQMCGSPLTFFPLGRHCTFGSSLPLLPLTLKPGLSTGRHVRPTFGPGWL